MEPYFQRDRVTIFCGDCRDVMRTLDANSIDAIVTDPPYGLEFMGKDWDKLDGDGWRTGGGFSKPGFGKDRPTAWAAYGSGDTANATCATCGGRMRGKRKCECETPDWKVKGKSLDESTVDSRGAQGRKMQEWHYAWAVEALRVLKPGAHLLAFGGTRTFHRLTCAVEDAGFEIRDCLMWLYGSGFPKSLDVSKAIDKAAGVEREVVGFKPRPDGTPRNYADWAGAEGGGATIAREGGNWRPVEDTAPATDAALQWSGYGTALKPAYEPIIVARKPLEGTVAANVQKWGTGAINIDGCRVEGPPGSGVWGSSNETCQDGRTFNASPEGEEYRSAQHPAGRFPANVIHDGSEEVVGLFPEQSGGGAPTRRFADKTRNTFGTFEGHDCPPGIAGSSGSASRFFYTAKADRQDRSSGVGANNTHPTVKPTDLMRYLVRLVCPAGALVLDPFLGSGSTIIAARAEHCRSISCDTNEDYVKIAVERLRQGVLQFTESP